MAKIDDLDEVIIQLMNKIQELKAGGALSYNQGMRELDKQQRALDRLREQRDLILEYGGIQMPAHLENTKHKNTSGNSHNFRIASLIKEHDMMRG